MDIWTKSLPHYPITAPDAGDALPLAQQLEDPETIDNSLLQEAVALNLNMDQIQQFLAALKAHTLIPRIVTVNGELAWQFQAGSEMIAGEQLAAWLATH